MRVLDKEPWDFDRSLIVMGRLKESESVMDVMLSTAVFLGLGTWCAFPL